MNYTSKYSFLFWKFTEWLFWEQDSPSGTTFYLYSILGTFIVHTQTTHAIAICICNRNKFWLALHMCKSFCYNKQNIVSPPYNLHTHKLNLNSTFAKGSPAEKKPFLTTYHSSLHVNDFCLFCFSSEYCCGGSR